MVQESDIVREEINETRDQLTEKLVNLEDKIRAQVETAKTKADETIENVREVVRHFNPRFQIEESPLIALGASLGAGVLVGTLAARRARRSAVPDFALPSTLVFSEAPQEVESVARVTQAPPARRIAAASEPRRKGPGLLSRFADFFDDEINMAKGMLVTALAEGARELLKEPLPQFTPQIDRLVDSVKRKVAPAAGADMTGDETFSDERDPAHPGAPSRRRSGRGETLQDEENFSVPT